MPSWFWILIVALDVIVTSAVLWWVFTRRRLERLGGMTLAEFLKFSQSAARTMREYMAANYSGQASQLESVLPGLLARLEEHARSHRLPIERAAIKSLLPRLLATQKLATEAEVQKALASLA